MNRTQFLQSLAHRGPGYDVHTSTTDAWIEPRNVRDRFLRALTHSGPGYTQSPPDEIAEIKRSAENSANNMRLVLLESLEKALYVKGHIEAASRSTDPQVCKEQVVLARDTLRDFLHHLQNDVPLAMSGVRESTGPLDVFTRIRMRRTERALKDLLKQGQPILEALANDDKRPDKFEYRSRLATREVNHSIETFSHLAAAR